MVKASESIVHEEIILFFHIICFYVGREILLSIVLEQGLFDFFNKFHLFPSLRFFSLFHFNVYL